MIDKKFIVTGGGSGGHVSAASAIINTLIEEYGVDPNNITYIGGDLGMVGERPGNSIEQKRFKDALFNTRYIRAGKLQRTFSLSAVSLLLRSLLGFKDAFKYVADSKADAVISTGGFVSVPVCIWAKILGKPIFLHEQTASVGLSNRVVGRFSKKIYTAFKESNRFFNNTKVEHVGNIVRKAIFRTSKDNVAQEFIDIVNNEKELPLVYISGGGLGSHIINEKILRELPELLQRYKVILQTGENATFKDFERAQEIQQGLDPKLSSRFLPTKYIEEEAIGYVYNNMNIFLGRSGANTVYELGILKKPAVFVPIPWVTHNEQYLNAKVLEDLGTGKIISEKDFKDTDISKDLDRFLQQIKMRDIDSSKFEGPFPVNAASRMIEDICTQI